MPQITFALTDGIFISIFSIILVFLILFVITLVVQSLKSIHEKPQKVIIEEPVKKILSIEDIKNEDMMVAALVASIDYQSAHGGNVRVTSINQIN